MKNILLLCISLLHTCYSQDPPISQGDGVPPRVHMLEIIGDMPIENNGANNVLTLECTASGNPIPKIEWSFNGVKFVADQPFSGPEGTEPIRHKIEGGKLIIKDIRGVTEDNPKTYDTGRYRCIASNEIGTVFAEKFLQIRVMGVFASGHKFKDSQTKLFPVIGQKYVMPCPPHIKGYGTSIRWGTVDSEKNVDYWLPGYNPRIFQTLKGELVYSVVNQDDITESRNSGGLRCILLNYGIRRESNQQVLYQAYETKIETRKPEMLALIPKQMVAPIESSYYLICGAVGFPVPTYRWEYQGRALEPLRLGGKELNFEFFEFVNDNRMELRIRRITQYSGGTFKCYATNSKGEIWTDGQLSVAYPPKFMDPLFEGEVHIPYENKFVLRCNATGFPRPRFEWFHNSTQITKQSIRRKFTTGEKKTQGNDKPTGEGMPSGATLTFLKTEFSDNGIYICVAINDQDTITQSTFLKVRAMAPVFEIPLDDPIYLFRTENMMIHCQPSAGPVPTRTWTKDGTAITTEGRYVVHENGTLEIKNVEKADKGIFKCSADNPLGKAESSGTAIVLEPTVITHPPQSQGHQIGFDGVRLFCGASWDPRLDLRIEWYKGGVKLAKFSDHIYLESRAMGPPRVLYINNLTIDDAGNYSCHAYTKVSNVVSEQWAHAKLTIKGPPEPPAGVHVTGDCENFDAMLRWTRGEELGVEGRRFYIEFSTNVTAAEDIWFGGQGDKLIPGSEIFAYPGTQIKFKLTEKTLVPGANLIFRLRPASDHLVGRPSRPSKLGECITPPSKPRINPLNVTGITKGREGTLFITWRAIRDVYYGAPGFFYEVGYKAIDATAFTTKEIRDFNVTEFEIPTPGVDKRYEFYVQSKNSLGEGPEPKTETANSGKEPPRDSVEGFGVKHISRYSVELEWERTRAADGYRVTYYNITDAEHLRGRGKRAAEDPIIKRYQYFLGDDAQNGGSLTNITAQLNFLASVAAVNSGGIGPESELISFQSKARVPGAPSNVKFRVYGRSAHLSWSPPIHPNGYIEQYEITWSISIPEEKRQEIDSRSWKRSADRRDREIYIVDEFEPLTYYDVQMFARNRVGPGADWERILVAVSADDIPGKPGAPKVVPYDDTSINVTFQMSDYGGLPREFYIYYRPKGDYYETPMNVSHKFPQRAWFLVKDLNFAVYDFWTIGVNEHGQSETSDVSEKRPIRRPKPQARAPTFPWYRSNWFIAVGMCLLFVCITMVVIALLMRSGPKAYRSLKEEREEYNGFGSGGYGGGSGSYPAGGTKMQPMQSKEQGYPDHQFSDGPSDHDMPPPRYSDTQDRDSMEKKSPAPSRSSRGSSRSRSSRSGSRSGSGSETGSESESETGSETGSETRSEYSDERSNYSDEEKKRNSSQYDDEDGDDDDTTTFV